MEDEVFKTEVVPAEDEHEDLKAEGQEKCVCSVRK